MRARGCVRSGSNWRPAQEVDTWRRRVRRQFERELRGEQKMKAEKRRVEEKTSVKFQV